jgi:beta-lactamase class A
MRYALAVLACTSVVAQTTTSGLTRLLEGELSRFPAKAGVCLTQLKTGEEACVHPDELFNSASVIKIPVLVMAFQMADQKKLNLSDRIEMGPGDYRGGSGVLKFNDIGQKPTIHDVLTEMVITSDNSATDLMIAKVGGVARVNQWLDENGYKNLHLNHTAYELFRRRYELVDPKYQSLTPEQLFALGTSDPRFHAKFQTLADEIRANPKFARSNGEFFERMKIDQDYWLGSMSPRDTMRLIASMEQGKAASKESCADMMRILLVQKSGERRLPHFLNVPVGHKTGDYPPAVANDVGVIYARSGPIAIAFFTRDNTGVYAETEDRIGEVARLIVEYFDGAGR